jgi:carboxymethylenebutenolidase
MFHFGANDPSIPPEAIAAHRERLPQAQVFVYEGAGHAFNRDVDPKAYVPQRPSLPGSARSTSSRNNCE